MASKASWSTGLCDCCDDCGSCMFYAATAASSSSSYRLLDVLVEIVDRGANSCTRSCVAFVLLGALAGLQIQWLFSCGYRSRLREQYQLPEKPCDDCLVHCFCGHLALCQEYRELTNRGFDMAAGWRKNVEMQTRGVTTAPAVTGGMSR